MLRSSCRVIRFQFSPERSCNEFDCPGRVWRSVPARFVTSAVFVILSTIRTSKVDMAAENSNVATPGYNKFDREHQNEESGQVAAVLRYPSYLSKEVCHTAITLVFCGILSVAIGIGHVILAKAKLNYDDERQQFGNGYAIWIGVVFVCTGGVGLFSRSRPSRGTITAAGFLAFITILCAFAVTIITMMSLFLTPRYKIPKLPHRRTKRLSIIPKQMFTETDYFADSVSLMAVFVVVVMAAINLLILTRTTLTKRSRPHLGQGNAAEESNEEARARRERYFNVNIAVIVMGVLSSLLGIGQIYITLENITSYPNGTVVFRATAYPVWLSFVFIMSGVYGIRSCADRNLLTLSTLAHPVLSVITAASLFGYSISTLFIDQWNYKKDVMGIMADNDGYVGVIVFLFFVYLGLFICGVLQIYHTVKITRAVAGAGDDSGVVTIPLRQ